MDKNGCDLTIEVCFVIWMGYGFLTSNFANLSVIAESMLVYETLYKQKSLS